MGLLTWLTGVTADLPKTIDSVSNLYTTDKERLAGEQKLEETAQKPVLAQYEATEAQIGVNKVLAASSNLFVSGYQPLYGWTLGGCLFLYWVPHLVLANYLWIVMCLRANQVLPFPVKPDEIYNLIYLIFGYGSYGLIKKKMAV